MINTSQQKVKKALRRIFYQQELLRKIMKKKKKEKSLRMRLTKSKTALFPLSNDVATNFKIIKFKI